MAGWISGAGYKKALITTDNEPAVRAFVKAVASKCTAEVALRTRIVRSPESLGVGEQAVGQTAGMVRTLMSELEQRLG